MPIQPTLAQIAAITLQAITTDIGGLINLKYYVDRAKSQAMRSELVRKNVYGACSIAEGGSAGLWVCNGLGYETLYRIGYEYR